MRELIRELAAERQMAVLLSSHILAEVEQVADRVGILHEGRLVEEVSMGELRDRGRTYLVIETRKPEAAVRLLEERLAVRRYTVLPGGTLRVYEHVDRPEEVARVLIEHGLPVTRLAVQRESLEDHFLRATAEMGTNPDGRSGRAS